MSISRQTIIALLCAAIILGLAVIFWPFVLNSMLRPAALVAWLFLRMFVLSIGQRAYWVAIILVAFFVLLRFLSQSQKPLPQEEAVGTNEMANAKQYWRILFSLNDNSSQDETALNRELTGLLVTMYTSKQRGSRNFEIYAALKSGQIPLPENIQSFLFPKEQPEPKQFFEKLLHSLRKIQQKWLRRWSGQEKAEKYRMLKETLAFMEKSLEIKNDQ